MNKASYDRLPSHLQRAIDGASGAEFSAFAGRTMQALDDPGRSIAERRGNRIIALNPDEISQWKQAAASTQDQWINEMNEKGLDGERLVHRAKRLIAKFTDAR